MRRWLLRLAAAFSLLLLLTTAALWVRSRYETDAVDLNITWNSTPYWRGSAVGIASWEGHLDLLLSYHHAVSPASLPKEALQLNYWQPTLFIGYWAPYYPKWNWFGFYRATDSFPVISGEQRELPPMDQTEIEHYGVPDWFLVLMFAILPAASVIAFIRRRRAAFGRGHCVQCGYDLRASKGRCPECGTAFAAKVEATA